MSKTTIKAIRQHFKDNNYEPRHDFKGLKYAANMLSNETKIDAFELLLLVIDNKPITSQHTHSYGFHTSTGRYLIETFKGLYFEWDRLNDIKN